MRRTPFVLAFLLAVPVLAQSPETVAASRGLDPRFKVDLLLVVAHPDDESAFAGYLARAVLDEGRTAAVVYLADGVGGQSVSGTEHGRSLGYVRQFEARSALALLGIEKVWFLGGRGAFSTNVLKSLAGLEHGALVERLVDLVRLTRPEVILTWIPANLGDHADHQASGVLATEAYWRAGDPTAYPAQLAAAGAWDISAYEYGGLQPWQPKRLYFVTDGSALDPELDLAGSGPAYALSDPSPSRNVPYVELAARSAAEHRTQEGFLGLSEALARGTGLPQALADFEAFYGFPFFPDPIRFVLGAPGRGVTAGGDLFAGLPPAPSVFSPPMRTPESREDGPRVELGGVWSFYSAFWTAYELDHLAGLAPPTAWVRRDEPFLRVPLLLVNPTPQAQVIEITARLPAGWEAVAGPGSYVVPPHATVPVEGQVRMQARADTAPGTIVWGGWVQGRLAGSVPLRVAFSPGPPQ